MRMMVGIVDCMLVTWSGTGDPEGGWWQGMVCRASECGRSVEY